MMRLIHGRIDRNLEFLITRYGWVDLIFRELDLSFLPEPEERQEVDKYEKEHFTESTFLYHVGMIFYGMSLSDVEDASEKDGKFRDACMGAPISRHQVSRDLNNPKYNKFLRGVFEILRGKSVKDNKKYGEEVYYDSTSIRKEGRTYEGTGKVFIPKLGHAKNGNKTHYLKSATGEPINVEITGKQSDSDGLKNAVTWMIENVKKPNKVGGDARTYKKDTLNWLKTENETDYTLMFNHTMKFIPDEDYPLAAITSFISNPTNEIVNDEWGQINGVDHKMRKITVLKNPAKGFTKENIYEIIASSDKTTSEEEVNFYRGRYGSVEFDFKELKLNLSMEDYRARKETAIKSYIILVFITFMLMRLFLKKIHAYGKSIYAIKQYILFPVPHILKKLEEIQKDMERSALYKK